MLALAPLPSVCGGLMPWLPGLQGPLWLGCAGGEGGVRLLCSPRCWPLSSPTDGPPDVRVHAGGRAKFLHWLPAWPPGAWLHGRRGLAPAMQRASLLLPPGVSWCSELAPDSVRTGTSSEPPPCPRCGMRAGRAPRSGRKGSPCPASAHPDERRKRCSRP